MPAYHDFDAVRVLDQYLSSLPHKDRNFDEARSAFDQIERALFNLRLASERAGVPLSADVECWADRVAHRLLNPDPVKDL